MTTKYMMNPKTGEPMVQGGSSQGSTQPQFMDPGEQSTPENKALGWGEHKPKHMGEMPENMPGMTEWEVTEDQTLSGQLSKNLSRDNPMFEQMRERAQLEATRAGRQNSLLAGNAAESRVVDMAFQISAHDSQLFARSAEFNALMKNQFSRAEQDFMHQAMLSDQNFNQATELQAQQIAGQLAAIAAQTRGQIQAISAQGDQNVRLAELGQEHWLEQNEHLHGQNLEVIGLNHNLDLQRLGVLQDFDLERIAFSTEAGMAAAGHQADLQMAAMDRAYMHNLQLSEQQYGHQAALNYQAQVFGLVQTELQGMSMVGGSGATPEQQTRAYRQMQDRVTAGIDLMGALFAAPSGPAYSAGVGGGNSRLDYMNFMGSNEQQAGRQRQTEPARPGRP